MSVTFTSTNDSLIGWDLRCVCGATYLEADQQPMEYKLAEATLAVIRKQEKGLAACAEEDCFTFGIFTHGVYAEEDGPAVNISNTNSIMVLSALGIMGEEDSFSDVCSGTMEAEAFLGRVLMAAAVAPVSAERLTEVSKEEHGPTVVTCGVEEGYLQLQLDELQFVAEFALSNGRKVTWG